MAAAEKQNPDWQRLSGVIRINQAKSLAGLERYPEALQILTPLIDERRKIVAANPDNRQSSLDLLNTIKIRGDTFFWANRFPEALTDYTEAIEMLLKHTTRDPADRGRKDNYADALRAQAKTFVKLGKMAEAEAAGRMALGLRKELADDPGADAQSILVYAFTALEIEPENLRQPREALAYYYKAKRSGKPVPKELDKWIAELEAQVGVGH
jgi:tetratricopeptide (TPR) repeat protein